MKTKFTLLIYLLIGIMFLGVSQVSGSNQSATPPCLLADLAIEHIEILNVSNNKIDFSYTLVNVGHDTLHLNRMYFQTYVSQDAVYNNSDVPSGGAIFGNLAPDLTIGDTYQGNATAYTTEDLNVFKYVILQINVIYGKSMPECSLVNNTSSQYIGCVLADLVALPVTINSVNGNSVNFTYTVENTGWDTLFLNKMYFQTYVSKDPYYDVLDVPAGGSTLFPAPFLLKNQQYSGSWTSNSSVSLTEYPYLIIQFKEEYGQSMPECNTDNNSTTIYIGCNLADLVVQSLNITAVNGNMYTCNYSIKNSGWGALHLSKMYFQAYVSKDAIYDATDKPAGGSILGDNAPDLLKDQSYSGTWSANATASLTDYPYLIFVFKVRYEESMPECNTANNTSSQYIGCNLSELVVSNFTINCVNGGNINFNYTIKNNGWNPFPLNQMSFKTFVSLTNTTGFFAQAAGESIIGNNAPVLLKDQEYTGTWTAHSYANLSFYRYFIIQFMATPGYIVPECNYGNNTSYIVIPLNIFSYQTSGIKALSPLKVSMNPGNKTLSVTNDDDSSASTAYKVYSVDAKFNGQAVSEGTFTGNKVLDCSGFKPGLYIIQISNGSESHSEKFMINE